jgi:hypothetical protein
MTGKQLLGLVAAAVIAWIAVEIARLTNKD